MIMWVAWHGSARITTLCFMQSELNLLMWLQLGLEDTFQGNMLHSDFHFALCLFFMIIQMSASFFFSLFLFIWLCLVLLATHGIFDVACRKFLVWHMGSSSLTKDQTWTPCIGNSES